MNKSHAPTSLNRRIFLKTTVAVGGGLMIGAYLPGCARRRQARSRDAAGSLEPNIWLRVNADDTVRVMLTMLEMGQGVMTSMPMLVAEELDIDWKNIKTEWVPADAKYGNPNFGGQQLTAGSNSVRGMWKTLREAGAGARAMLVAAAAQTWNVPENTLTTEKGEVIHKASGRRLKYGALVDKAATLPVPKQVTLKRSEDLHADGHVGAAARHPRKGQRLGGVRHGRQAARPAHRARRPLPGVWRQGRQLQRRQSQGRSRRQARRPDQQRHRRRRRQLLGREQGRAGARDQVGRRKARDAQQRRHHEEDTPSWRSCRARSRAIRANVDAALAERAEKDRARLRSAVPGARDDGADELHG